MWGESGAKITNFWIGNPEKLDLASEHDLTASFEAIYGFTFSLVGEMKVVTVHLPEAYLEAIDELVRRKRYPNRAEAIRMAVRDFIRMEARLSVE